MNKEIRGGQTTPGFYSKIVPRTAIRADGLKNADDFFDFLKACFIRCVFIEHAARMAQSPTTAFTQQRLHRLLEILRSS